MGTMSKQNLYNFTEKHKQYFSIMYNTGIVISYTSSFLQSFYYITYFILYYIILLADIPWVARDSIRNEGTREINYGSCISASRPDRITPRERAPGTQWIGGWVGPRTGLEVVEKRNIFPCRQSNPGRPARSPLRRHGHGSDKNGVYPTSHLFFTWILSLIASFMWACS
jgi:hypothetical protein